MLDPASNRVVRTTHGLMVGFAIISAIAAVLVFSCEPGKEQLKRLPSPDGVVDAVLVAKLVNATVATPYLVYIVPSGSSSFRRPVLVGDDFMDLKLIWKGPRFLVIRFSKGEIFEFTNLWRSASVQNFEYLVEIKLEPLSDRSIPLWDQPTGRE